MKLNEYQQEALKTAVYPREFATVYPALGMNGEAGKVADKIKKSSETQRLSATIKAKWFCQTRKGIASLWKLAMYYGIVRHSHMTSE